MSIHSVYNLQRITLSISSILDTQSWNCRQKKLYKNVTSCYFNSPNALIVASVYTKQLLTVASGKNQRFRITLYCKGDRLKKEIAQVIKLGVKCNRFWLTFSWTSNTHWRQSDTLTHTQQKGGRLRSWFPLCLFWGDLITLPVSLSLRRTLAQFMCSTWICIGWRVHVFHSATSGCFIGYSWTQKRLDVSLCTFSSLCVPSAVVRICIFCRHTWKKTDVPAGESMFITRHKKGHEGNTLLMIILFFRTCYQRMN